MTNFSLLRMVKVKIHQNATTQEKKDVINNIIHMYPSLRKDKEKIMKNIVGEQKTTKPPPPERVFEKITLNDKIYFRDNTGWLWENPPNSECRIIGAFYINKNKYVYHFFTSLHY